MRILVTNDDGVHSDGIFALKTELAKIGEVFVVAPERPRSAAAHAITLHKPVRLTKVALRDGSEGYAVSGTPADCVVLGAQEVMDNRVDLVVSGINHGPNLGWDVHYSGTVAAAKEAAMIGHRSIAISVASYAPEARFDVAARFAVVMAERIAENPLPIGAVVNVNVPDVAPEEILGAVITYQGPRQYVDRFERRTDPSGRSYYWLGGTLADGRSPEGSDVHAIAENLISVTPLQLDMTSYDLLDEVRGWKPFPKIV
jgi:5'-nucleotidase